MAQQQFLSGNKIDEFIAAKKPIWIRNLSGAMLIIDMSPPGSPNPVPLNLVPSMVPFCLTDYFTPEMVRSCFKIRSLISDGHIALMNPDDPSLQNVKSGKPSRGIVESTGTPEELQQKQVTPRTDAQAEMDPELEELEASPKIAHLCDSVENQDMTEMAFLNKIKEISDRGELTEHDLSHVISSMKGRTSIIDWATNALAEMRETRSSQPRTSSGSDEELNETAAELISRSGTRGSNTTGSPGPNQVRAEFATMSEEERNSQRGRVRTGG